MNSKPEVTVLMASYGRLSLLKESLESALKQEYPSFEVLIIDDGSDEDTKQWLYSTEQQQEKLRVVFQDHLGVATARARGVDEAYGDLICILDSDDILVPHALSRLVSEFKSSPQTVLVYTCNRVLRPNGEYFVQKYPYFKTPRGMLWATMLQPRVPFKHSGTMFKKKVAAELGSYDRSLACKIDIDFFLKFLIAGYHLKLVPEPLVDFRRHTDSISMNRALGVRAWFRLIDRYGPRNYMLRQGLKAIKAMSELSKSLYMKVATRSFT